jgi:hypothetical protein
MQHPGGGSPYDFAIKIRAASSNGISFGATASSLRSVASRFAPEMCAPQLSMHLIEAHASERRTIRMQVREISG